MKPESGGDSSPQALQLLRADDRATAYGDDHGAVEECPLKKKEKESGRVRVMLWHLSGLGGGFRWAEKRRDELIAAYATVIVGSECDICVIMGLTRSQPKPTPKKLADGTTAYFVDGKPEDTGVAEVERISAELAKTDGAGGWQAAFAKNGDATLYQRNTSSCFLYKSAKGIQLDGVKLVKGAKDEQLGFSGDLACAAFTVPLRGQPVKLPVLAPLAVGPPDPDEQPLTSDGEVPGQCVLAFSLPYELAKDSRRLADFRAVVDAEYLPLPNAGSVPAPSFWEKVREQCGRLMENPLTLNPFDIHLQDQHMNWLALPKPTHPTALDEVVGRLSDLVMLKNGEAKPLKVEEVRVIDLVRASLADESANRGAEAGATPLEKEHRLAQCLDKLIKASEPAGKSDEDDATNHIHASIHLSRLLSEHWPVMALLSIEE